MQVDFLGIQDFLALCSPFDQLPAESLENLSKEIVVQVVQKGHIIYNQGEVCTSLVIVRYGTVETISEEGDIVCHLGEKGIFGGEEFMSDGKSLYTHRAIDECLFYKIPRKEFLLLLTKHPDFANYFYPTSGTRLRGALLKDAEHIERIEIISARLGDLISREVVHMTVDDSIRNVAKKMVQEGVGSMLLCKGESLAGIITDLGLRTHVVAEGRSTDDPISTVMTENPITLESNALGIDALILMAQKNIDHIPIVRDGKPIGMITTKNLAQNQTTSAVYLVREAYKQNSIEGLQKITEQIPRLLQSLVRSWVPAQSVGHVITSVTDAVNIRLIQMAEEKLGPPPVPYSWCVVGSQGRGEQTVVSDQDSFLLLSDRYDKAKHGKYFKKLTTMVCDDMDRVGYRFCPGEIMAKTKRYKLPLKQWKKNFKSWIEEPSPKALMLSCIFFDLRMLYGKNDLFIELKRYVEQTSKLNRIYLAHMTQNALTHKAPLGFFRNFVLIRGGEHNQTFNLKNSGIIPIVDITRIHALASGVEAVNTLDRLKSIIKNASSMSKNGSLDLQDAFEFINQTRLRYHASLLDEGMPVSNYMSPDRLSNLEREHLKDAFAIVQTMQSAMKQQFQGPSFG
ncbi:MAG: cyclic nucleotide-binding/CBS domain-containing protein [Magnetococcales bacterium]|nr:cyclic nucleotide-binding/CBS domain-containing protein [Magnetococcales bacterium]